MAQVATSARAPRGTKILTKAFFTAANDLPAAQRAAVIKATLVAIRDEMKASRKKAAAAKKTAKSAANAKSPTRKIGIAKKIGRPLGSKNNPKIVAAPVVVEEVAPKVAKEGAPRAKPRKQASVKEMAAASAA